METNRSIQTMRRRYRRLAAQLAKLGPILQGTIAERTIVRSEPKAPGKNKSYGPYYQWTWKRNGKTITVNLTASQAKSYQRAINNQRNMQQIIKKMRELSLRILQATTTGVKKRKPRSQDHLQLK